MRYFRQDGVLVRSPCKFCGGLGERTFRQSAEKRASTNVKAKERKARKLLESIETFKATNPIIWAWMSAASQETFAAAMRDALLKWGGLTEKQFAASLRCSAGRRYG